MIKSNIVFVSFNRTFMELKSCLNVCYLFCKDSFNRTFMELKCCGDARRASTHQVLIVPLWN